MDVARTWLAAGVCILALTGCGDTTSPDVSEEPAVDETSSTPAPQPPPPAGSAAEQAVEDLAATLGVDPAEVEVVAVEEVTWRDGSLGCAQPGMVYTQALVDGTRIVLRAGGTTYEYHAGGGRPPTRCEQPTE